MSRPQLELSLLSKQYLTVDTLELTFQVNTPGFSFISGQFISLEFEWQNAACRRSYSIASSSEQLNQNGQQISIAMTLIPGGKASGRFSQAKEGETFIMTGPFGALTLPATLPENMYLIGTGTGIAPYRSMIPQLKKAADQGCNIAIIMGVRRREDIFYAQDFQSLAKIASGVKFTACLSREQDVTDPAEFSGRVTHYLKNLPTNPESDLFYLCGNPAMVEDGLSILDEKKIPAKKIKREKYTFSR